MAQIILPAISLGRLALAPIARIPRASMLATLGSDFVLTARACGLSRRKILITYAFRNALLPVVNVLGMVLSFVLGSNVLIEDVYGWPGVGAYAVKALIRSDYAAVQGFILMIATLYIMLNLLVDLASVAIDRSIRAFASKAERMSATTMMRNPRYSLTELPHTSCSHYLYRFGVCAIIGPDIVPYSPLATDYNEHLQLNRPGCPGGNFI